MKKGYGNVDGWLGFIIGDKIFIDFTKYEYDDSFKVSGVFFFFILKNVKLNRVNINRKYNKIYIELIMANSKI